MSGFRGIDDLLSRDVFIVAGCQELEQLNLLLGVELCSESATGNKLESVSIA